MVPTDRQSFLYHCLRRLGYPVLEINVSEEQADDRIDEALKYYMDYHFAGSEKVYYKQRISDRNYPDRVYEIEVKNGGTGYSNTDTVTWVGDGQNLEATLTTDNAGTVTSINISHHGNDFRIAPEVSINTSTGSGAELKAELGGFIVLPENIIGAVRIFDLSSSFVTDNMFSIQYQIALNDLYTLTSQSMVPYYMTMSHLNLIQQLLVGKQLIRYNRHRNRLHIDMNWDRLKNGHYIIVEAYEVVDPEVFADVWGDRWLQQYCTALIKKNWGTNMKKFNNMQLPGGITFNGQQIYDEAVEEINKLEEDSHVSMAGIPQIFMG